VQKFNFGYYFLLGTGLVSFILFLNFEGTREEKKREREKRAACSLVVVVVRFFGLVRFFAGNRLR